MTPAQTALTACPDHEPLSFPGSSDHIMIRGRRLPIGGLLRQDIDNAYVDGPLPTRLTGITLNRSLAIICPASAYAVAHDRGPRWFPLREFQTSLRPLPACASYGLPRVSDRSVTICSFLASSGISSARQPSIIARRDWQIFMPFGHEPVACHGLCILRPSPSTSMRHGRFCWPAPQPPALAACA